MNKYGFIYLWYDRKRRMYYLGCHWGTEDDGYICSSNRMRNVYKRRPQDFKRRVIQRNISRDKLFDEEHRWLKMISENDLGKRYYNLRQHRWGHWSTDENSNRTIKEKLSEVSKKLHQDPIYREKFMEGRKKLPPRTEEAKKKTAIANTGKKRSDETRRKISESNKGKIMGPLSEKHRKNVSDSLKGAKNPFYGKQHDPEKKKEMSAKASATMKGRRPRNIPTGFWWNNGTINKRTNECPGQEWTRGKI